MRGLFPSVLLQRCGVGDRKSGFTLVEDPRTSHRKLTHRKFTITLRFNVIHGMDEDEVAELGTRKRKHIPAADSTCVFVISCRSTASEKSLTHSLVQHFSP